MKSYEIIMRNSYFKTFFRTFAAKTDYFYEK